MTVRVYKNRHNASFLPLVRSMADERWVYDSIDYQLMDMYFYEDYILMNEDYITLVMEDPKGEVVGFIVGTIRQDSVDIKILFVAKTQRGNGYGKLLKQGLTRYTLELGKNKITAYNNYSNSIVLRLNETLGWEITPVNVDEDGETDYYKAEYIFTVQNIGHIFEGQNIKGDNNESN